MRVQVQIRSICPAWAKQLESHPKTTPSQHRPASGELCRHNCGFALDSWWVYQWADLKEIQALVAGAQDPVKCQLCGAVARPGKTLCGACADLETERRIETRVEDEPTQAPSAAEPAPEPVKRRGRPKKETPAAEPAPPVTDECVVCGAPQCDCQTAPEDLL